MQETSTFLPDFEVLRPLLLEVFWICFVASHEDSENKIRCWRKKRDYMQESSNSLELD